MLRSAIQQIPKRQQVWRQYARDSRESFTKSRAERLSLKERAMAPPGPNGILKHISLKKLILI